MLIQQQPEISKRNPIGSTWLPLCSSVAEKASPADVSLFFRWAAFLFSLDVITGNSRRITKANVHWVCPKGRREKTHLTIKAGGHCCTNSITWEAVIVNVASDPHLMGVTKTGAPSLRGVADEDADWLWWQLSLAVWHLHDTKRITHSRRKKELQIRQPTGEIKKCSNSHVYSERGRRKGWK